MQKSGINFTVLKSPEGGYVARAPDYSIFTQADTMEQLKVNVVDAFAAILMAANRYLKFVC